MSRLVIPGHSWSPLVTHLVTDKHFKTHFRFENYEELPKKSYVENNGHTVKLTMKFKDLDRTPKVRRRIDELKRGFYGEIISIASLLIGYNMWCNVWCNNQRCQTYT